jgi:AraC-like DNA-binding protein
MDPLSLVLSDLRLESTLYCALQVTAPWGVAYPGGHQAGFHVITSGACDLIVPGRAPLRLEAGDMVVLPRGTPHRLEAGDPVDAVSIVKLAESVSAQGAGPVTHGGGGALTEYLCGAIDFGARGDHPMLSALPDVIHVRGEAGRAQPWMEMIVNAMACEQRSGRVGGATVLTRLSDVLFVQALRAHLAELPAESTGWMGALRDPVLSRAIACVHRAPERNWTVETLARESGQSRSQFAVRFTTVVGVPPLAYVTRWRMYRARVLLRDEQARVGEVARLLGYSSETAFSTAFKREVGVAPREFKRAAA